MTDFDDRNRILTLKCLQQGYQYHHLEYFVLMWSPTHNKLVVSKLVEAPSNFYCWPSQGGSSVLVLL